MSELPLELDMPLRLAKYSQPRGSGRGCAMNVVSWEKGDQTITDHPDNVDEFFSSLIQVLNDNYCTHLIGGLLCAPCSIKVLRLAHLVVGLTDFSIGELRRCLQSLDFEFTRSGHTFRETESEGGFFIPELSAVCQNRDSARLYQICEGIVMAARTIKGLPAEHQVSMETTQRALKEMAITH